MYVTILAKVEFSAKKKLPFLIINLGRMYIVDLQQLKSMQIDGNHLIFDILHDY